jgi:hypothetical protein
VIIDQEYCCFDASTRRLTVLLGKAFGNPEHQVRLRSWEEGGGIEVRQDRAWQRNDEAFDFPISSEEVAELDAHHPVRAYYDTLPENAAKVLRRFASHQCRLLHVFRQYPRSSEMATSSPILCWLASSLLDVSPTKGEIATLFGSRRNSILGKYCGVESKSHLKFLTKISEFSYQHEDLNLLRDMLRDEAFMKKMRHVRAINWPVLRLFYRQPYILELKCALDCLSASNCRDAFMFLGKVGAYIRDIRRMCQTASLEYPRERICAMKSAFQIKNLHDTLAVELNRKNKEAIVEKYGEDLPSSPLRESENIVHISKVRDLLAEGEEMKHCVGGYVERVMSGDVFIYRIFEPERATVEVERMPDGKFRIVQVKSYKNGDVSNKTLILLKDWLGSSNCDADCSCYEIVL